MYNSNCQRDIQIQTAKHLGLLNNKIQKIVYLEFTKVYIL